MFLFSWVDNYGINLTFFLQDVKAKHVPMKSEVRPNSTSHCNKKSSFFYFSATLFVAFGIHALISFLIFCSYCSHLSIYPYSHSLLALFYIHIVLNYNDSENLQCLVFFLLSFYFNCIYYADNYVSCKLKKIHFNNYSNNYFFQYYINPYLLYHG